MVSSLPSRPISLAEIHSLDQTDSFRYCKPLVAFASEESTEEIISCAINIESGWKLLGYEEGSNWSVIDSFSGQTDVEGLDRVADRVLQWATETYDSSEIAIISPDDIDQEFAAFLPHQPLGRNNIALLESLPGIDDVHPLFCKADSHEIVALLTFQRDLDRPEGFTLANYGFEPESARWQLIERRIIDDTQETPDPEDLDIHIWVEDTYEIDDLVAISPDPV